MHSIAERLLNRGNAVIDLFAGFPGHAFGNSDILGKRAVAVYADNLHILADMRLPGAALVAVAAGNMGFRRDEIAGNELGYLVADLDDLAGKLMTKDTRGGHAALRPHIPLIDMHVCATDRGS